MVFGLLGAVLIFTTLTQFIGYTVLQAWFNNLNSSGVMTIGAVLSGVSFFIVYGFLIYSVANVSFNLINVIPDRILSWIGSSSPISTSDGMQEVVSSSQSAISGARSGATGFLSQQKAYSTGDSGGGGGGGGALPSPSSSNNGGGASPSAPAAQASATGGRQSSSGANAALLGGPISAKAENDNEKAENDDEKNKKDDVGGDRY